MIEGSYSFRLCCHRLSGCWQVVTTSCMFIRLPSFFYYSPCSTPSVFLCCLHLCVLLSCVTQLRHSSRLHPSPRCVIEFGFGCCLLFLGCCILSSQRLVPTQLLCLVGCSCHTGCSSSCRCWVFWLVLQCVSSCSPCLQSGLYTQHTRTRPYSLQPMRLVHY